MNHDQTGEGVAVVIPSHGLVRAKDGDSMTFQATRDIKAGEVINFPAELWALLRSARPIASELVQDLERKDI